MKKKPVVFTPGNEPYLGRRSLHAFDELIVACMKSNALVAPYTHQIEKSDLQTAACQIIPSGISLSLSVRELVRQGYLYGALVLMRPLAERAMILLYLHRFPEAVSIWTRGWSHKERPSLSEMFNRIGGAKFPNCGPEITRSLNSLTHGDPASAMWNLIESDDGEMRHPVSKILNRHDLCDRVAGDAAAWLAMLVAMMYAIFPGAFTKSEPS
jgi:hypothetical protein